MITLLFLGIMILTLKMTVIAFKMTWGITKTVLFVLGLPLILLGLIFSGVLILAAPLLLVMLIGAFLFPVFRTL
ncbi:MAG: hypothetical protein Q4E53_06820 [Eubacteriales bacterium]|nr:hypothetical protein [Eubacteriales bacterium]